MASLHLFRMKFKGQSKSANDYSVLIPILMTFACMQSGLTRPPPVHGLAVCAEHSYLWMLPDILSVDNAGNLAVRQSLQNNFNHQDCNYPNLPGAQGCWAG